MVTIRRQWLRT